MSTGRVVVALSAVGVAIIARSPLEQTMQRHMLMQLPMLFGAGMLMGHTVPLRGDVRAMWRRWNVQGVAGLLVVSGVLMTWMVPRALDAAVEHLAIDALKLLSLVAAGAIALYSWRVASAIVRTFVIGNMAWRTATIWMLLLDAVAGCASAAVHELWLVGSAGDGHRHDHAHGGRGGGVRVASIPQVTSSSALTTLGAFPSRPSPHTMA